MFALVLIIILILPLLFPKGADTKIRQIVFASKKISLILANANLWMLIIVNLLNELYNTICHNGSLQ